MTIARMGLKFKVMALMGQANAVGPTSIKGSLFSSCLNDRVSKLDDSRLTVLAGNAVARCDLAVIFIILYRQRAMNRNSVRVC